MQKTSSRLLFVTQFSFSAAAADKLCRKLTIHLHYKQKINRLIEYLLSGVSSVDSVFHVCKSECVVISSPAFLIL